jgi:hypothetical protein
VEYRRIEKMALDFTVVIRVRQRFGDDKSNNPGLETDAPFVGVQKDFAFVCPKVDRSQDAFLLFQSQGVDFQQPLLINGQQIFGGIPSSTDFVTIPNPAQLRIVAKWSGNVMIIEPGVLQVNNVLRIQAGKDSEGKIDNFIIDNLIVVFKTTGRITNLPSTG